MIDLDCLKNHYSEIARHVIFCDKARDVAIRGGNIIELLCEISHDALATTMVARCSGCKEKMFLKTSNTLSVNGSRHFDVNVRAVWGAVASGNGLAHMNEFLCTIDSPIMSQNTFSTIESKIRDWWKELLNEDFSEAITQEKQIAIEKGRFHEGWYQNFT